MHWQLLRFLIHPRGGSTLAIEKAGGNAFGGLATSGAHLGKRVRHRQSSPARAARPIMSHAFRCVDVRRVAERPTMQIKMAILGHAKNRVRPVKACVAHCARVQ